MTEQIPPGERRELRSVVRQQFKVLRTEVRQREAELMAAAERRLMDRYRDEDKALDDLNWKVTEIVRDVQRQVQDLLKTAGDQFDGGQWMTSQIHAPRIRRKTEDRSQLHAAMVAGIKEQVRQALLALDRQEADLLRELAMEALETGAARAFLGRIPSVAELVPAARLREIEATFDERASR